MLQALAPTKRAVDLLEEMKLHNIARSLAISTAEFLQKPNNLVTLIHPTAVNLEKIEGYGSAIERLQTLDEMLKTTEEQPVVEAGGDDEQEETSAG